MPVSAEVRRLEARWQAQTGWPQRLDFIEIDGIRGWRGQRFSFPFPIMAVVGENGVGKSTVLQAAASVYASPSKLHFASDFFPDTFWDRIRRAEIRYALRQGEGRAPLGSIRKPGGRWRGNPEREERYVEYIDLRRLQPVSARRGYLQLAKPQIREASAVEFDKYRLERLSQIMGRPYDFAQMSTTEIDDKRSIPVISLNGRKFSGFHQGSGEMTMAEFLQSDPAKYSLVLIDEIETSLHPKAQRRLIRDLAELCRERELQIILTTHSPYVLEELPLRARACIIETNGEKQVVYGVSPEFAMSKMDDHPHHECDLYVEDERAAIFLMEMLSRYLPEKFYLCRPLPYGAGSVGKALGLMKSQDRFPDPTCVFLDGDQGAAPGCINLPGDDPPERVVFEGLAQAGLKDVAVRLARPYPDVIDAVKQAMALKDSHEWVRHVAIKLTLSMEALWQVLCSEWVQKCFSPEEARTVTRPIEDALLSEPIRLSRVETTAPSRPSEQFPDDLFGSAKRPGHGRP